MSRYRLWLDCFSDVFKYEMKYLKLSKALQNDPLIKRKYKMCESLQFVVDKQVKNRFSLIEIDSLLAGYQDESEFLQAFFHTTKTNYKRDISSYHLLVTYKQNQELKELEQVYNSPLLQKYALLERGKKSSSRILKDTKELQQFCIRFLRLVEDQKSRKYVFCPFSTDLKIEYEDSKKLAKYIPFSRMQGGRNPFYESLERYSEFYDRKWEKADSFLPTLQEDEALVEGQKQIYRILRSDYSTLRNAVLFMQTVEGIKEKEMSSSSLDDGQYTFVVDDENKLSFMDATAKECYYEYLADMEENKDILAQLALEQNETFRRKYEGEDEVLFDDYSFEETESFSKNKRISL